MTDNASPTVRALHNPDSINQPPSTPYANASIDPAAHYFYFFENDRKTAEFVADVFSSIAACADRHDCPFNVIFCGESPWPGACESPPGRYGFVRDPNQYGAQLNNRPRTGLPFWLCDAGLELPRNPIPCSTPGGLPSLGYALLQQIVQADIITRPDVSFLQQKAKQDNITDFHNGSPWTLKELAFLTNAEVKGRSVANAENYARFASWSWDLGFGGSPWTGETCQERFAQVVNQQTLIRLGRSVLETGGNFGGT
ncbi:MAG: hypothetical protein L6R41_000682 [Letrouitia leprolyta]|nr:MAG: hypothetical protein L6R41_000682 [Letrouitia leprolyta]